MLTPRGFDKKESKSVHNMCHKLHIFLHGLTITSSFFISVFHLVVTFPFFFWLSITSLETFDLILLSCYSTTCSIHNYDEQIFHITISRHKFSSIDGFCIYDISMMDIFSPQHSDLRWMVLHVLHPYNGHALPTTYETTTTALCAARWNLSQACIH